MKKGMTFESAYYVFVPYGFHTDSFDSSSEDEELVSANDIIVPNDNSICVVTLLPSFSNITNLLLQHTSRIGMYFVVHIQFSLHSSGSFLHSEWNEHSICSLPHCAEITERAHL